MAAPVRAPAYRRARHAPLRTHCTHCAPAAPAPNPPAPPTSPPPAHTLHTLRPTATLRHTPLHLCHTHALRHTPAGSLPPPRTHLLCSTRAQPPPCATCHAGSLPRPRTSSSRHSSRPFPLGSSSRATLRALSRWCTCLWRPRTAACCRCVRASVCKCMCARVVALLLAAFVPGEAAAATRAWRCLLRAQALVGGQPLMINGVAQVCVWACIACVCVGMHAGVRNMWEQLLVHGTAPSCSHHCTRSASPRHSLVCRAAHCDHPVIHVPVHR